MPGHGSVWIYDGRLGERYRDPNTPTAPLEYNFPAGVFAGDSTTWPMGMSAAGGKDLIGDQAYPDLAAR